jgi:hypothetical protein
MISGNLEYLMSSLPNLSFQNNEDVRFQVSSILRKYGGASAEELSLVEILDREAEKFLSPTASRLLRRIDLQTIHDPAFQQGPDGVLSAFSKFAFSLKEAVRQLRLARRTPSNESAPGKLLPGLIPGTPLEEEIQLMKFQWDQLEALSIGHYADFGSLVIYKIKLMILIRWWSFDKDLGFETFNRLTKQDTTWPIRS